MFALIGISAFFIVLFGMPNLIKIAKLKKLVDDPEDLRKIHHRSVPTIGGVMIFFTLFTNGFFWLGMGGAPDEAVFKSNAILASCLAIIFTMGLKDDLIGMSASKKLLIHLFVGGILVTLGEFRIEGFGGLFGIETMPAAVATIFSLFVYIVVVNAWNLIDGIDGLAGGYSVIAMIAFSHWFLWTGQFSAAVISLTMIGSMLGFLVFNFAPARIFLGDCGSLVLGLIGYTLATKVINTPNDAIPEVMSQISKPILAMAILAYPLVDTLRVFFLRAIQGISPFNPDQNHLHHRLMMRHNSHSKTAISVYLYSTAFILLAFSRPYLFPDLNEEGMFFGMLILSFLWFLPVLMKTRATNKQNVENQKELALKKQPKILKEKGPNSNVSAFVGL